MTSAAMLIADDILTPKYKATEIPRQWSDVENELCTGTWLLGFFDALLFWEETSSDGKRFVEILTPMHKYGMNKLFQLFCHETRIAIVNTLLGSANAIAGNEVLPACFCKVRSKRLGSGSLLLHALTKAKFSIKDMELAIPSTDDGEGSRRSKRVRR